jgi:threonine/homoserine/homoserine lactone efflux protein
MADPHTLLLFALAALAVNLAPGPDMLYVLARSAAQGPRPGIAAAAGVFGGCCVHMAAAALGFAALLAAFPWSLLVMKYAGCAYLCYLGAKALLSAARTAELQPLEPVPLSRAFAQGALTNVLNPKVALFFLAFLPQFASAEASLPVWLQMLLLGLWFNLGGLVVNVAVAGRRGPSSSPSAQSWR